MTGRATQLWRQSRAFVWTALVLGLISWLFSGLREHDAHGMWARYVHRRPLREGALGLLKTSRASTAPLVRDFTFSAAEGLFVWACHDLDRAFWSLRDIEPRCFDTANTLTCYGTRCVREIDREFRLLAVGVDRDEASAGAACPTDCSIADVVPELRTLGARAGRKLRRTTEPDDRAAAHHTRRWGHELGILVAELNQGGRSDTRGFLSQLLVKAVWQETCDELHITPPGSLANAIEVHLDSLADLPVVFIECDFVKLTNGGLRYRNGAWVALPH